MANSLKSRLTNAINDEMAKKGVYSHNSGPQKVMTLTNSLPEETKKKKKVIQKNENNEATASGASGGYDSLFSSKIETKESTSSSSSGQYSQPSIWAKSMKKKDWRGASKTQIPGGKFVQVKKKCKTFPYCNQGDIKALKIFENKTVQKVLTNLSQKYNVNEDVIKNIIIYEYNLI